MSSESIQPIDQSIPTNSCTYDAIELILKKASLLAENLDHELSTGNQTANKSSSFTADITNDSKEYSSDNINKKNHPNKP
jgi:ribosomal protein S2